MCSSKDTLKHLLFFFLILCRSGLRCQKILLTCAWSATFSERMICVYFYACPITAKEFQLFWKKYKNYNQSSEWSPTTYCVLPSNHLHIANTSFLLHLKRNGKSCPFLEIMFFFTSKKKTTTEQLCESHIWTYSTCNSIENDCTCPPFNNHQSHTATAW